MWPKQIKTLLVFFLAGSLLFLEILPSTSQEIQTPNLPEGSKRELLLSFLNPVNGQVENTYAKPNEVIFVNDLDTLPTLLSNLGAEINDNLQIIYTYTPPDYLTSDYPSSSPPTIVYRPEASDPFSDILPPLGSPLQKAYQAGAEAWYQERENIIVIFPDQITLKSFNKITGQEGDWLADKLAYAPIDTPGALSYYQINYNGKIVAETTSWVLMKFPSGGYLKIAKENRYPSTAIPSSP